VHYICRIEIQTLTLPTIGFSGRRHVRHADRVGFRELLAKNRPAVLVRAIGTRRVRPQCVRRARDRRVRANALAKTPGNQIDTAELI